MLNQFVEIPASKNSLTHRKPIFGVGVNDASYTTQSKVNGRWVRCPYYSKWVGMINRCYSPKVQEKQQTYKGCSVSSDWLLFSNFKIWMIKQDWENKELDKDLIAPGNKIYSSQNCCFIPNSLNSLLCDSAAKRGKYPQGVSLHKPTGKFSAGISVSGKKTYLGIYLTPELASKEYIKRKVKLILQAASEQDNLLIANGLRLHAELLTLNKGVGK